MKRTDKEILVTKLHEDFAEAKSTVLLKFEGVTVEEITTLRRKLRESSVDVKVLKNTLSIIASRGTPAEKLESFMTGPTIAAISKREAVDGIKALEDFLKTTKKLQYKAAVFENALFPANDIAKLAKLPSRNVLLSQLMGTIKAPADAFVRVMSGTVSGFFNVMTAIKDSKSES